MPVRTNERMLELRDFERKFGELAGRLNRKTGLHVTRIDFQYSEHGGGNGFWHLDGADMTMKLFEDPRWATDR